MMWAKKSLGFAHNFPLCCVKKSHWPPTCDRWATIKYIL